MPQSPKTKKASKGTQYHRGRRKEWDACKRLKEQGYEVVRSAGSHGLWDVCAVGYGFVFLVQVKYGKTWKDANVKRLSNLPTAQAVVQKRVWHYTPGISDPKVYSL